MIPKILDIINIIQNKDDYLRFLKNNHIFYNVTGQARTGSKGGKQRKVILFFKGEGWVFILFVCLVSLTNQLVETVGQLDTRLPYWYPTQLSLGPRTHLPKISIHQPNPSQTAHI